MVKANVFLPSVNAGEFSTKLLSRIDFGKYPNGAALLKNYLLQPQGGFYRRPGFRHIVATKSDGQVKLVPFVFDVTDSYIIEIGNLYMRFIRRQAQITVADTDAAITNGTFASNITGWTDRSTGSAGITHSSAEGGEMSLDGSAGDTAWAEQSVTTSNTGTEHVLRFKSRGVPGLKVKVQIGSATLGDQLFEETALGVGYGPNGAAWAYHTVAFTPDASPFYVQFKNDNNILDNSEDILIDDVSFLDNAPLEIETPWTTSDLTDLKFDGSDLSFVNRLEFEGGSFALTFTGKIDGNTFTGNISTPRGDSPITLTRADSGSGFEGLIGTWKLTGESQFGPMEHTLIASPGGKITYESSGQVSEATNLKVEGNTISFDVTTYGGGNSYDVAFKGSFDDDGLRGDVISNGSSFVALKAPRTRDFDIMVGTWNLTGESQFGPMVHTLIVTSDGTFTYESEGQTSEVSNLKIDGNSVSFDMTVYGGGNVYDVAFEGSFGDEGLAGDVMTNGSSFSRLNAPRAQ